jgi:hypothetical protein
MSRKNLVPLATLCTHYQVEMSFFSDLIEYGLIEIDTVEHTACIRTERIPEIEKMIRIHHDLHVNMEGIDVVWNLLQKMSDLQNELMVVRSRLRLYED